MTEPVSKMGYEGKALQAQASLGDDLWDLQAAAAKLTEFTAGRSLAAFQESEVLLAVTRSMIGLMAEALRRIRVQSPEIAARLAAPGLAGIALNEAAGSLDLWHYLQDDLPGLLANATVELETWHEG